ncbi:nucleolar protein dao-5-like isoform X2 [Physella acuta]|uniref:nucleolar protein dao-5-like isoform X2 n=1 Tax=Physella acuta TaxID=109671 RepID=UPI0027DBC957|nr:nucleolar protein dao-5-like isoform X2 [Physella acuta]
MPRTTRRSAASKEEPSPEPVEAPKTPSRPKRGAKKEEPAQEEVPSGEPLETPTKRGRQAAKAATPKEPEVKEEPAKRGKSATGGRSTSRGRKGRKQEESEEEQEPEEKAEEEKVEEEEEEKTPRGGARSKGKGRSASSGGRGKGKAVEEEKEEEEDVKAVETPKVKAAAVTPSPKGGRKPRGKASAEDITEEEKKEDAEEKMEDEKEGGGSNGAETKGRQKRTPIKAAETAATPPSGGRKGRGQKTAEPAAKASPTPPRSSRRGASATATPEAENATKEEAMETAGEEAKMETETASTEKTEDSVSPGKKRKLGEEEDDRSVKRLRVSDTEDPLDQSEEASDFVVVNKEDVPAPDSKEVTESLPPAVPEPVKPAEDKPADPVVPTSVESSDSTFVVPLTEVELTKQYTKEHKQQEADETSSILVEVGSEAASDITGFSSRTLDVSDALSMDSGSGEQSEVPMDTSLVTPQEPEDVAAPIEDIPDAKVTAQPSVTVEASLNNNARNDGLINVTQDAVNANYVPSSTSILKRKFILNKNFPADMMDPAYCFSVVSYNVLAECHMARGDYSYTPKEMKNNDFRTETLLKELEYLDGDIVCLQEVSPSLYKNVLVPAMAKNGYAGDFIKRTKDYWEEGEATFVKTSKFTVLSSNGYSLTDLAFKEVEKSALNPEVSEEAKKYLDRADVILLTSLLCLKTKKTLTVCNIHVVYDDQAPDVKCIQICSAINLMVALAVRKLVSKSGSDMNPHIICGDFNSDHNSPGYHLAKEGYLSDNFIQSLQNIKSLATKEGEEKSSLINSMWGAFQHTSSHLTSAYRTVQGKEPSITTYTKNMYAGVDYIFHSSLSLDVVGVLEVLDEVFITKLGGLPNTKIPSDHLSLKAVFRMKE